jgi:hypothetical protein
MGSLENRTPSTFKTKEIHKAGPRKASKAKRNFRINGDERGASPMLSKDTKYVRSGGPQRHDRRVARNIARQERLKERGAMRRIGRVELPLRKAAEHVADGIR